MNIRNLPWRKLLIVALCSAVIGNGLFTLILYAIGRPDISAWTGRVMQSTPSATNDLLIAIVLLIIGVQLFKHE